MIQNRINQIRKRTDQFFTYEGDQFKIIYGLLSVLLFIVILRKAWCGDDAFITFRVIDNFVNGFGLRFNVGERVQAFTHPLWLFLLTPFYFIFGNIELVSAGLSLVLTGLTVFIAAKIAPQKSWKLVVLAFVLLSSRAFTDYSSSGLENPLSHFLLAVFLLVYLDSKTGQTRVRLLSFLASLLMLNRMDLGLIVLPALIWVYFENPTRKQLGSLIIGMIPLLIWEVFSIIYYGFPFPNTAYAKLNAGVPESEYLTRGLLYYFQLLSFDPVTFIVILVGPLAGLASRWSGKNQVISIGILLYLGYIVWIGGDFMMGRFFTAPLVAALLLLQACEFSINGPLAIVICTGAFCLSTFLPETPVYAVGADEGSGNFYYLDGISDARKEYLANNLGISFRIGEQDTRHSWKEQGIEDNKEFQVSGEAKVVDVGPIGMRGFYAGPSVHLIDTYALSDPLLARIPSVVHLNWRPGHLIRPIPVGYPETLKTGINQLADEGLHQYYEQLKAIVSGPIFSTRRWIAIAKMNLGLYDYLIDEESYRHSGIEQIRLACDQSICEEFKNDLKEFNDSGLEIQLDVPTAIQQVTFIGSTRLQKVQITFLDPSGQVLARQNMNGWGVFRILMAPEKITSPVARIRIYPTEGSGSYSVTSIVIDTASKKK